MYYFLAPSPRLPPLFQRAQRLMEEEDDENEGESVTDENEGEGATDDTKEDEDEAMDEDEVMTRLPGHGGVPPLPGQLQAVKVNGVVHANRSL